MFLGIIVYFLGLLDDDPKDLKQMREKGKIVVQICDSVNEKFQKIGLDIEFQKLWMHNTLKNISIHVQLCGCFVFGSVMLVTPFGCRRQVSNDG